MTKKFMNKPMRVLVSQAQRRGLHQAAVISPSLPRPVCALLHAFTPSRAGQARRADAGGHQAVLRGSGEGGVEVRHADRPVRHPHHHAGAYGALSGSCFCIRLHAAATITAGWLFSLAPHVCSRGVCSVLDSIALPHMGGRRRSRVQAVIFCNTKKKVDWLAGKLRDSNHSVSSMHGDMPQKERDAIMAEFRSGA